MTFLKQLDRYRNGLAQPLRQASDEMICPVNLPPLNSSAPEIDAPLLALEEQEEEDEDE